MLQTLAMLVVAGLPFFLLFPFVARRKLNPIFDPKFKVNLQAYMVKHFDLAPFPSLRRASYYARFVGLPPLARILRNAEGYDFRSKVSPAMRFFCGLYAVYFLVLIATLAIYLLHGAARFIVDKLY